MTIRLYRYFIPWCLVFMLFSGCVLAGNRPEVYPDLAVDIPAMKQTVSFLCDIQPVRTGANPGSLDKAASFIEKAFKHAGLSTTRQSYDMSGKTFHNIIGTFAPERADRLIVGAHYDVCGDQPGADDNASAVAGLIEVARLVSLNGASLSYGVDVVAYTLEEPPYFGTTLMGSYVHAKSLHDRNVSVKGMICLEMIGYYTTQEYSQDYPLGAMKLVYPKVGNFIGVVANMRSGGLKASVGANMKRAAIDVETLSAPESLAGVDFSDHRNYWQFQYDAVMVTDTAFFRNPNYHRTTDTPDTLNYEKMAEVVKGVTWAALNL